MNERGAYLIPLSDAEASVLASWLADRIDEMYFERESIDAEWPKSRSAIRRSIRALRDGLPK